MAVRRFDSNVGDFITLAIGNLAGINTGAFTIAGLVKKEADGGFFPMVSAEATASSRRSLWTTSGDVLMSNTGGFNINTPVGFAQSDDWAVVAVTKPAGEELTRGHKGVLGGAWTHTDGDEGFDDGAVVDNIKIGTWQDGAHWHGLIAVIGAWERELSDAELEDGLRDSLTAWVDAAPDGLWALNQESAGTALVDLTGGGADQTAIDGTSVVTDDDPPGFSFESATTVELAGAAEVNTANALAVSKAVALAQVSEQDAGRALTAAKAVALSPATVIDLARPLTAARVVALAAARETNAGNAPTPSKVASLAVATEQDAALSLSGSNTLVVDAAVETNTPRAVAAVKTATIARAAEANTARTLASGKAATLGAARTTEAARPITVALLYPISSATTADGGRAFTAGKLAVLGVAIEADRALAMTGPAVLVIPGLLTPGRIRPILTAATTRPLLTPRMRVGIPAAPPLLNALLNPSLFGWPDATNTGVPESANLTDSGPLTITTPAAVVEDLLIDGTGTGIGIEVRAPNVVIRRVHVIGRPQPGGGCIKQTNGATGMRISFSEFEYDEPGSGDAAIGDGDFLMEWCNIHRVAEGVRLGQDTTFRHNFVHSLLIEDPDAHADGIQSTGGGNMVIHRNTLRVNASGSQPANAAAIIGAQFAAAVGIEFTENLLDYGSYCFYLGPSESFGMSDVLVRGNRFGRNAANGPTSIDVANIDGLVWENNQWDDGAGLVPAA